MFVGYEEYVAVAICLFCTWLDIITVEEMELKLQ